MKCFSKLRLIELELITKGSDDIFAWLAHTEIQRRMDVLLADGRQMGEGVRRTAYGRRDKEYPLPPRYHLDPDGWLLLADDVARGHREYTGHRPRIFS